MTTVCEGTDFESPKDLWLRSLMSSLAMKDVENEKSLLLLYFFNSNWVYTFENTQAATHCTLKYMYTCIHIYIHMSIYVYLSCQRTRIVPAH